MRRDGVAGEGDDTDDDDLEDDGESEDEDEEIEYDRSGSCYSARFTGWSGQLPGLAAGGGHVTLVWWLLDAHNTLHRHLVIHYNVDAHCLLVGAAAGCPLAVLTSLYGTFMDAVPAADRERTAHAVLLAAATSATPDWQAKAAWVLGELFYLLPEPVAVGGPWHSDAVRSSGTALASAATEQHAPQPGGSSNSSSSSSNNIPGGIMGTDRGQAPPSGRALYPQSGVCTAVAALPGALPRLLWLQERGCPLDAPAVLRQVVCVSGDADVLTHLLQHHGVVPSSKEVKHAACLGHVEVLQVLLRNHPYGRGTAGSAPGGGGGRGPGGKDEDVRDWFRRAVLSAAWCGQVHVLAWLARARRELLAPPAPPPPQQTGFLVAGGSTGGGQNTTAAAAAAAAAVFPTPQEVLSAAMWDDAIGCEPYYWPLADNSERRVLAWDKKRGAVCRHPPGLDLPDVWKGGEWWKWWKLFSSGRPPVRGGGDDGFMAGGCASVLDLEPPLHERTSPLWLRQRDQQQLQQQRLVLLQQPPEQRVLRTLLWLRHEGTWWPAAPVEVLLQRMWRAGPKAMEWLRRQGFRVEWWEVCPPAAGSNSGWEGGGEEDSDDDNTSVSEWSAVCVRCSVSPALMPVAVRECGWCCLRSCV